MKVLVVDDNYIMTTILRMMIEKKNHQVITANDGEDGYAAYLQFRPDMVLKDIQMPGKNGFELMTKSFSSIYKFFHFTRKLHLSEHSKFHLQSSDRDTLNVVMHFFLDTQENSPILHSHKIGRSHRSIYFTDSNECCLV